MALCIQLARVSAICLLTSGLFGSASQALSTGHLVVAQPGVAYMSAQPGAVAAAPDGGVWISEGENGRVAHANPDGKMTEIVLPAGTSAGPMTVAGDGSLWYADVSKDLLARVAGPSPAHVYRLPPGIHPSAIVDGPDGSVWFTASGTGDVGRLNPSTGGIGMLGGWPAHFQPEGIAVGPGGAVWVTDVGNDAIVQLRGGKRTTYPIPAPRGHPTDIVLGDDGNMWFDEVNVDGLGRITPAGTFKWFPLKSPIGRVKDYPLPSYIAASTDGIWISETGNDSILRLAPDGAQTTFQTPINGNEAKEFTQPTGIARAGDGSIWFAESGAGAAGRIDARGNIAEFAMPQSESSIDAIEPTDILPDVGGGFWLVDAAGSAGILKADGSFATIAIFPGGAPYNVGAGVAANGDLWITEYDKSVLARVAPDGTVREFPTPTASSQPSKLAVARDGTVWFIESKPWKIGKLTSDGAFSEYALPKVKNAQLAQIIARPDGGARFMIVGGENTIESIDSNGVVSVDARFKWSGYPGIAAASDGALWYQAFVPDPAHPASFRDTLAKRSPDGTLRRYPVSSDYPLAIGVDGTVWFAVDPAFSRATVGHLTGDGRIEEFVLPSHSEPAAFAYDANGDMWFADQDGTPKIVNAPTLGKVSRDGKITEYRIQSDRK